VFGNSNRIATMPMTSFCLLDRWTPMVRIVAEIDCAHDAPHAARLGQAVGWAWRRGLDLSGLNLGGADLSGARLRGRGLREVDLRAAILRGADLRDTDLRDADLSGADLAEADLGGAVLRGAALRDTDLSRADLYGADLSGADLSRAVLGSIPVVPAIDARILAAIAAGGRLETAAWHTSETTHCRAGWAIKLAGAAGEALEQALGAAIAGTFIYAASRPGLAIPDSYASTADALADLSLSAARQASTLLGVD
jgi:uncharacterized protein YjbI with pentapeptide repeats